MTQSRFATRQAAEQFLDESGYRARYGSELLLIEITPRQAGSFGCEAGWYAWNRTTRCIQRFEERPSFSVPPVGMTGMAPSRRYQAV